MAERFAFSGLREIFAKANEEKSGDRLAGIAAGTERERVAAKIALADVPLRDDCRSASDCRRRGRGDAADSRTAGTKRRSGRWRL